MMHNQSVNIWSHFLPAVFICVFIISFAMIVDHKQIGKDLTFYQKQLAQSFQHYTHALDNLTLIQNMKQMKHTTELQLEQIKMNAMKSFNTFAIKMNRNMENLKQILNVGIDMKEFQQKVRKNFQNNLQKLHMMKHDYENIIAPALIDQLNSLNNTYMNSIRQKMLEIKDQIDSDNFKYMDLLYESPNPHHVSRWPLVVFLVTAFICLMCSTLFHLFYPMSDKSYKVYSRFDYAGISLLIAGSSFPPLYYGMYCYIDVALIYSLVTLTLAIAIFILSMFEWMHRPQHKSIKAFIYGGFGFTNVVPLTHMIINDYFFDNGDPFTFVTSIPFYIGIMISYTFGLYIYTIRCPERNYPGRFNLCGHSHQIWHMFVVFGIVFTYFGAIANFQMRKTHECPVL